MWKWLYLILVGLLISVPTFWGAYIATRLGSNPWLVYGMASGFVLLCSSGIFIRKEQGK